MIKIEKSFTTSKIALFLFSLIKSKQFLLGSLFLIIIYTLLSIVFRYDLQKWRFRLLNIAKKVEDSKRINQKAKFTSLLSYADKLFSNIFACSVTVILTHIHAA